MKLRTALVLSTLTMALVACQKQEAPKAQDAAAAATAVAEAAGFDLNSIPLSKVALGEFPFIKLPEGYVADAAAKLPELTKFPFFAKGATQWVEGKFASSVFGAAEGKPFVAADVKKHFDAEIEKLGGVKVSEEKIPADVLETWAKDGVAKEFLDQFSAEGAESPVTYLIRNAEGNVWVNLLTGAKGGAYVVAQQKADAAAAAPADAAANADAAKAAEQGATVPAADAAKDTAKAAEQGTAADAAKAGAAAAAPAAVDSEALKQEIEKDGKIELNVRFVTGKADIDAASKPQVQEIAEFLKANADVKLEVNGHTDSSGNAAQNKALSEKRAKAVVDALVAAGVPADRLVAQGFGDTQPIADNNTAEGKEKNRRVELVKVK
ncbi:MAG: OmpA family protein [Acinetobacter sp.]|nr:OmpA family protein [Acinetobacter sp.]